MTLNGDPPDDAVLCDDASPCEDPNSVCVPLTESFGACIQLCDADVNESSCEAQGLLEDCSGFCFSEDSCAGGCSTWLGDEFCDDGSFGVDFNCEEWDFDGGACEQVDYPACPDDLNAQVLEQEMAQGYVSPRTLRFPRMLPAVMRTPRVPMAITVTQPTMHVYNGAPWMAETAVMAVMAAMAAMAVMAETVEMVATVVALRASIPITGQPIPTATDVRPTRTSRVGAAIMMTMTSNPTTCAASAAAAIPAVTAVMQVTAAMAAMAAMVAIPEMAVIFSLRQ